MDEFCHCWNKTVFSTLTFACVLGPSESGCGQCQSPGEADTAGKEGVKDGAL